MDVNIVESLNFAMPESAVSPIAACLDGAHHRWPPISPVVLSPHNGSQPGNPPLMICVKAKHRDLPPHELVPQGSVMNPMHVMF